MEMNQRSQTRKRKRNEDQICKKKGTKKSTKILLADRIHNESPAKDYLLNEIVIAAVPGYPVWPGRILSITGETIVVEFFGTGQM